jgi:hypothetical protein
MLRTTHYSISIILFFSWLLLSACSTSKKVATAAGPEMIELIENSTKIHKVFVQDLQLDGTRVRAKILSLQSVKLRKYNKEILVNQHTQSYLACTQQPLGVSNTRLALLLTVPVVVRPDVCAGSDDILHKLSAIETGNILNSRIEELHNQERAFTHDITVLVNNGADLETQSLSLTGTENGIYTFDIKQVLRQFNTRPRSIELHFQGPDLNQTLLLADSDIAAMNLNKLAWDRQEYEPIDLQNNYLELLHDALKNGSASDAKGILSDIKIIGGNAKSAIYKSGRASIREHEQREQQLHQKANEDRARAQMILLEAREARLIGRWGSQSSVWKFNSNKTGQHSRKSVNGVSGTLTTYFNWKCDCKNQIIYYTQSKIAFNNFPYANNKRLDSSQKSKPFNLSGDQLNLGDLILSKR